MSGPRRTLGLLPAAALLAASALVFAACGRAGGDALGRGDRLLSRGEAGAAIAEYRLAERQQGSRPEILARLAHAYARQGDAETALQAYDRLLAADSSYRYQAAEDLTAAARDAHERGNDNEMARLLEPVVSSGLDLVPADLRLVLAGHDFEQGAYAEALPLLLSLPDSLPSEDPDARSRVLYETARAFEELGGCEEALGYFRAYLDGVSGKGSAEANSARWHFGNCLFTVAEGARQAGRDDAALTRLDSLVSVGVPRTLQDRAQFMRGEILLDHGRSAEALEAFQAVLRLDPTRTGPVARRAEERIREIRYGGD